MAGDRPAVARVPLLVVNTDPHAKCGRAEFGAPEGSDCVCRTGDLAASCARRGCGFCRAHFTRVRLAVGDVARDVLAFTDPVTIEDCAQVRDAVRARLPAAPAVTSVDVYARRDDVVISAHVGQVEVARAVVGITR